MALPTNPILKNGEKKRFEIPIGCSGIALGNLLCAELVKHDINAASIKVSPSVYEVEQVIYARDHSRLDNSCFFVNGKFNTPSNIIEVEAGSYAYLELALQLI